MPQSVFLHRPIQTLDQIDALVSTGQAENEHLDFKERPWTNSDEAVKDISAFANGDGGDIIIGVKEIDNRASELKPIPDEDAAKMIERLNDWMMDLLRPRDFTQSVQVRLIKSATSNSSFIVASIPASASLVGCARKTHYIGFPVRERTHTRWMGLEEVMEKAATSKRGMYIKLQGLVDDLGGPIGSAISFCSPVLISTRNIFMSKPAILSIYGHCESLSPDVIKVKMQGTGEPLQIPPTILVVIPHERERVSVPPDHTVSIPLELIRAAWKETKDTKAIGQGEHITLALEVKVVWRDEGQFWELMFG